MQFIIKDENYPEVVMSSEFSDLDKSLLVEITSYTATHQWTRMLECAEFVGAK